MSPWPYLRLYPRGVSRERQPRSARDTDGSGDSVRGDGDGAVGLDHRVGVAVGRELDGLLVVSSQCHFDALQRLLERRTGLVGELIVGRELAGELDLDVVGRDASRDQMV